MLERKVEVLKVNIDRKQIKFIKINLKKYFILYKCNNVMIFLIFKIILINMFNNQMI